MIPHVRRLTEVNPRCRRIHVLGEVHPGELSGRGYQPVGEEQVREIVSTEELLVEFQALHDLRYGFFEGEEWSPAEIYQKFVRDGKLKGDPRTVRRG